MHDKKTAARGDGQATLAWKAPTSNGGVPITDYAIQRSTDGGNHWKKIESAISMEHCPMAFPTRGIGIAVEADATRASWALQHASDNGVSVAFIEGGPEEIAAALLEPASAELLVVHAAGWHETGTLRFPVLAEGDMGGAVWTLPGTDVDYRGAHLDHVEVPAIGLAALLAGPAHARGVEPSDHLPWSSSLPESGPAEAPEIAACTELLKQHDIDGLRRLMSQAVLRRGLAGAVTEVFAPMTTRIGDLWMAGDLQVFQEHIYSESLQLVLRQAIQALPAPAAGGPRVLLTTLPGETHVLGLLMAEALLTLEGAACLSLGAQTPLGQLVAAAEVHRSHVVALSFSIQLANRAVHDGLTDLRALLPPTVEIWAGGASRALRQTSAIEGVRCLTGLGDITAEVTRLRELLESGL